LPVKKDDLPSNSPSEKYRNLACWDWGIGLITAEGNHYTYWNPIKARGSNWFPLLSGNPTLSTRLEAGTHTLILDFKRNLPLLDLVLKSLDLEGTFTVYSSNTLQTPQHRSWQQVIPLSAFTPGKPQKLSLGFQQTRYLMLKIVCSHAGSLSSLACMSEVDWSMQAARESALQKRFSASSQGEDQMIPYNFARLADGSRVNYISGGNPKEANQVLSENYQIPFEFPPSDDQAIMVIDMQSVNAVNAISLLFEAPKGSFSFIFLSELPNSLSRQAIWTNTGRIWLGESKALLALNDTILQRNQNNLVTLGTLRDKTQHPVLSQIPDNTPVLIQPTEPNNSSGTLNFSFPDIPSRYVVLYWERDSSEPIPEGRFPGLRVYQVNITGPVPADTLPSLNLPVSAVTAATPADAPVNTQSPITIDNLVDTPSLPIISP
jgi:hypothetical protein